MNKLQILIIIQTILNFIALDTIFLRWLPNNWIPDGIVGLFVAFIVWGILLILAYAIAVRFNNQEGK